VTSAAVTGRTAAHAQAPYPAPAAADSEEVGAAERWALLGIGLPAGAAFAFTLGSGLDKGNHPTWHYATVGGLYGLAATSLVAAVVIFFARTAPGAKGKTPAKPHDETAVVATASPAASH